MSVGHTISIRPSGAGRGRRGPRLTGRWRRGGRAALELARVLAADFYGRVGLGILTFFVVLAAIAPAVIPIDPWANNYRPDGGLARLDGLSWRHLLGTTFYGQDVFSQLVLGTRQTILVGFITAILIGFIGTNVGLVSGYFGGIVDDGLMRITDFFYAIPFLPFMMVVVALIDRSLPVIIASMAFIFWRTAARVVRAQVLTLKTRPYVLAARASGAGHLRIMYVHILPNVLPLGFLYLIFGAAWAILTEFEPELHRARGPQSPELGSDAESGLRHRIDPPCLVVGRAARGRADGVPRRPLFPRPRLRGAGQSQTAGAAMTLLELDRLGVSFRTTRAAACAGRHFVRRQ